MLGLAVDFIQYLSIGPEFNFTSPLLRQAQSSTTLNIEGFASYLNGGYGLVWTAVMSIAGGSLVSGLLIFFNIDSRLSWFPGCELIGDVADFVLPLIGNWMFVPIISVLMDAYTCVRGTAPIGEELGFTDSYMKVDCYEPCWQGTHLVYVVGSSVMLFLYTPIAILLRPAWQEMQSPLNIKTLPLLLTVKSVLQISLIILSKTVKQTSRIAHVFLYLGLMTLFLLFSLKFQCFGYRRTHQWHVLSIVAVIWAGVLSAAHTLTGTFDTVFLALLLGGWIVSAIGVIGYQLLWTPSLLYRRKGVDTRPLFKFAFRPSTSEIRDALRAAFQAVRKSNRIYEPTDLNTPNHAQQYAVEPAALEHQEELFGNIPRVRASGLQEIK